MSAHITFCGGVRTVTGSTHLLSVNGEQALIDAGLFQGHRQEYYKVNTQFYFNPAQLDAVILSHSHIDHSGNLPNLVKSGFRNKVFTTNATRDLCQLMLLDSAKIQEEDIKFVNKINARRGLPLRQPLYVIEDAIKSLKKIRAVSYYKKGQYRSAISEWKEVLKIEPRHKPSRDGIARAQRKLAAKKSSRTLQSYNR